MNRALAFGYGLAYLLGAFIAWEWNPAGWDVEGRFWFACMGLFFAACLLIWRTAT